MNILTKVPDSVELTKSEFINILRRNSRARRFGFSKKHTDDILKAQKGGFMRNDIGFDIEWNAEYTYLAS